MRLWSALSLLFFMGSKAFVLRHTKIHQRKVDLKMGLDIPLIPTVIVTGAAVFALFNIENKIDLTDEGRMKARRQRRLEREAKGIVKKVDPNADPFRYRWFEEDDDDLDLIEPKKGGGCGYFVRLLFETLGEVYSK